MSLNLSRLNPPQRQAVTAGDGPILVLSGAGTGKTRVITYRVAHLLAQGVPPDQILAVTFTNKAAREMKERVRKLTRGTKTDGLIVSTFHSLCARLLRANIPRLGYRRNFTIYDVGDQMSVVRAALRTISAAEGDFPPKRMYDFIGRWKNAAISAEHAERDAVEPDEIVAARVYRIYQANLRAYNALDFDDLLLLANELLHRHEAVRERYAAQFRHILVDEYQDTNAAQYRLVRALSSRHGNLCVVGDDDQSIYGWRAGADVGNILSFQKDWPRALVVRLEQNYRSTATILAAANAVISHNPDRHEKRLWTQAGPGSKIEMLLTEDEEEEAELIANRVQAARQAGRLKFGDVAVLVRINAQTRPIELACRAAHIPYVVIGGQSFFDRREVRDVLAYLKAIDNPSDEASLLRIVNTPPRGISRETIEIVNRHSLRENLALRTALSGAERIPGVSAKARASIEGFLGSLERWKQSFEGGSLVSSLRNLLTEIRYEQEIQRSSSNTPEAIARWANVEELLNAAAAFERDAPRGGLTEFLEETAIVTDADSRDDDRQMTANVLKIVTLHSAKGLEFPVVYLPGFEEGLLPHQKSVDAQTEEAIAEERRLCYVGITRAQTALVLMATAKRARQGEWCDAQTSRFLKDIPEELLERDSHRRPPTEEERQDFLEQMRAALFKKPAGS